VTYRDQQRLTDIQAAITAIRSHLTRGDLSDGLVFDAVRIRLLETGEAVKALPADLLDPEQSIPWSQIARMRHHLADRYFDTTHALLQATVDHDLPDLEAAVARLLGRGPPARRRMRGTAQRHGLQRTPRVARPGQGPDRAVGAVTAPGESPSVREAGRRTSSTHVVTSQIQNAP
jgi:uncharacterized protein with HEPN domain